MYEFQYGEIGCGRKQHRNLSLVSDALTQHVDMVTVILF